MNITVTDKAADKIKKLMAEENKKFFRIFVQGGGCSGFQYGLALASDGSEEHDKQEDEVPIEASGIMMLIDPISSRYLDGSTVDFADNLMGGGFTIKNPNATSTCGCGQSFQA